MTPEQQTICDKLDAARELILAAATDIQAGEHFGARLWLVDRLLCQSETVTAWRDKTRQVFERHNAMSRETQ